MTFVAAMPGDPSCLKSKSSLHLRPSIGQRGKYRRKCFLQNL